MIRRLLVVVIAAATVVAFVLVVGRARARDLNGSYAGSDPKLHAWFDSLASGMGLCCSFADGVALADPDIDSDGKHYRVKINGQWIGVPDSAIVTPPGGNIFGQAVVWPYQDAEGKTQIRCFMAGAGI